MLLAADLPVPIVECHAEKGYGSGWSWREIDGRRCWYIGPRDKPKSELRWHPRPFVPPRRERVPVKIESDSPRPDGPPPAEPGAFDRRWLELMEDLDRWR